MPEPPQLAPFDVEQQLLYSEPLPDGRTSHPISKGEARPDCRFLSFKKSETIYVYYKLSGRRPDIWAGSVGSHFGYFPKDLLAVNHIYTDNEYEVPAEVWKYIRR
uniref:SH3 domain-containing protein n=1 Tax=Astatotilapia calliptera TaxID=8154 RepID=A0AAX7VN23_ASTCA